MAATEAALEALSDSESAVMHTNLNGRALDVSRYPSICLVLSSGTNPNLASVGAVAVT